MLQSKTLSCFAELHTDPTPTPSVCFAFLKPGLGYRTTWGHVSHQLMVSFL